ncbi:M24 family metallopeptidase [Rubellimicrobium roseum]|uniref:M24 family metallopeptidase n=1 Tax=Rubellimicrobium roseum TaxID=687525 RepID=A0A5C4N7M4_9RHOB|nr:M24 family metallopeptidase [Rubellimicrobium roseum]TNC62880.1 M24 family metallopeptidase [Rubellimicrobium roseum]
MDVKAKLALLRERMAATGTDLMALGPGPNMEWVVGFHTHPDERPCLLMVTQDRAGFLMPALNAADARARSEIPMWTWADADGPDAALQEALGALRATTARRVAVDESMRADFALLVLAALPQARPALAADSLGELRMRKDEAEREELRRNAAIADAAMQAVWAAIRPSMTETEIAAVAVGVFKDHGAAPLFTIVGTGANGAYPHHHTGETVVKEGDVIVIDIGARKGAFSSDITRMALVGEPPADYARVHAVVEEAVQAALAAARPGVRAREVDRAARDVITRAGYGEFFVHRTGHGMGLEGHEPPYITESSETVLESGMVFSIEPGIYIPGRFGIRLEDIVILTEDGPEILSRLPRDAVLVR